MIRQVCHKHLNFKTKFFHAPSKIRSAVFYHEGGGNVDINNISKKEEKKLSNLNFFFFFALVVFLLFKTSVRSSSGNSKLWGKEIDGKRKSVLFHCFSSNYQAQIKEKCCHGTN